VARPFIWSMFPTKFGWNWPSGSWEEVIYRKKLTPDGRTDGPHHKLSWPSITYDFKKEIQCINTLTKYSPKGNKDLFLKYFFQYISNFLNILLPANNGNSQSATSNDDTLTTAVQPKEHEGMSKFVYGDSKQPGKAKILGNDWVLFFNLHTAMFYRFYLVVECNKFALF